MGLEEWKEGMEERGGILRIAHYVLVRPHHAILTITFWLGTLTGIQGFFINLF